MELNLHTRRCPPELIPAGPPFQAPPAEPKRSRRHSGASRQATAPMLSTRSDPQQTVTTAWTLASGILDLPRFRGEVRSWDQRIWFDGILSSSFE
jgi:hypothetical protein